jgi:hypothetical protein
MPTIKVEKTKLQHHPKIPDFEQRFMTICVASTVRKKEAAVMPKAFAAMEKERDQLEKQYA